MKLVIIAAILAVSGAAKLDRTYLPPPSAHTAGGSSDSLQTPLIRSQGNQGDSSGRLPTGSYTNNLDGVVVDAAVAGIRASPGDDQSGLGGARETYGSTNSKVGDAAFKGSLAGFRNTPTFGLPINRQPEINAGQTFGGFENKSERPQAFKDRNSNIITYANDVSSDNYSYGFETDNGISVGENGVANNGIQAQGGYSYKGDDGQIYKVTYVADEGGYRPQGAHLPTPPPIPKEILESLEQNAKEEAAGLVDDGSYDAQKYNAEGDYTHHNDDNIQYNGAQLSQFAKQPESDASTSGTFINQNSQAFGTPSLGQLENAGTQNTHSNLDRQSNKFNGNKFGSNYANNQNGLAGQQSSQTQESSSIGQGHFGQSSGSQLTSQLGQASQGAFGGQHSQYGTQKKQQVSTPQFGVQSSQLSSEVNQAGSASQFAVQPSKPLFGQTSNSAFNTQSNQGEQSGNQAFKPQGSFSSTTPTQNIQSHGKLSQYNDANQEQSQVSKTQFAIQGSNKPSFGTFGSSKPFMSTAGNNGDRFSNVPNQFGAEYLPPINSNDRPSYNKPQTNDVSSPQESNRNDNKTPNFISLEGSHQGLPQSSSASAFASVGPAGLKPQPAKPLNTFQNKPQNHFSYNSNNQLTSQGQYQSNALLGSSLHSGSHTQSVPALPLGSKPTAVPETELTTPLEPNEKPVSSQESQLNSQSTFSFGNFESQALNNQAQPHFGTQNIKGATQQSTSQNASPSFSDSRPQATFQFSAPLPTQGLATNQGKPQFPENSNTQNQENIAYFTTQKPSFSQGSDDSYYYNQPARPFNTPAVQSQVSRFPSSPSYQSNGVASSLNNKYSNQQSSLPSSPSLAPVAPTSPSQFSQTQESLSSNYYNGITQAAISPFPSVSPTTSTQYNTPQTDQFGNKPTSNQPSASQSQPDRPAFSPQPSAVPAFPSRPANAFGQKPTTSFAQNQFQFGQSLSTNNVQPSVVPLMSQNLPETNQEQQTTSTLTQQYQGTIYEYNKPAEVLPAPEQTDSSLSQTVQTDSSAKPHQSQEPNNRETKPQFGNQQTQIGQSTFLSQSQQSNLNQGTKPQFGVQSFRPFGVSPSTQFSQNTQSAVGQTSLQQSPVGSKPQFDSPTKPFGIAPSTSKFGQNNQLSQGTGHSTGFISHQGSQGSVQSLKPFAGAQSTNTQYGQNTQTGFLNQQDSGSQFETQPNKFSGSTLSQFGQEGSYAGITQQNIQSSQAVVQNYKPFGTVGLTQDVNVQPSKPLETTGSTQGFQGYPSSKPQFGTQLTHNQFTQSSQQTFGVQGTQADALPATPFASAPSAYGSPDQHKPQFGQKVQLNQGNKPSGSSFSQQSFQSTQYDSTASKLQFGTQTQYGQNQGAPTKLFSSASSQAQFGQNSAQASSSAVTQQQPDGVQTYKPFGSSLTQGPSFQNKPQIDQAPLGSSATGSQAQFGGQPIKPGTSVSGQNRPKVVQNKPFSTPGTACCQGSKGSAIASLNVGKPSQAFAQTQSQFSGFQGAEGFNAQSVAGKGEEFGGPRQPPSFDAQTGYHY